MASLLRNACLSVTIILVTFVGAIALGHPGGHGKSGANDAGASRTWTFKSRGSHVHGSFVACREDKVQIRCDDGKTLNLEFEQLIETDQRWIEQRLAQIKKLNASQGIVLVAQNSPKRNSAANRSDNLAQPAIVEYFKPFEETLELRWNTDYLFVGSNGMPDHPMMIGIRSWQQQVPIPQKYFGDNAWRIPLNPVPAKQPMSAKNNFLRGAIALAVNGVPIFNPLNNRGDDAFLFGELDQYGGHCGRADDYHYHLPPVHLEAIVGKGQPIAYALDGYPIFGYQEDGSSDDSALDWLNGHTGPDGSYHYHSTKTYPYLNGGFYGEVVERDGQVDPQPRAEPLRPALTPLRDAKIVDYVQAEDGKYKLTYEIRGKQGTVAYSLNKDGTADFQFTDIQGKTKSETYSPRRRPQPGSDRPPPPPPNGQPRRTDRIEPSAKVGPRNNQRNVDRASEKKAEKLVVKSSSVDSKGFVSVDCTCDGAAKSPQVGWSEAPSGTKCFVVSMWHIAPDQEKSYWLIYGIPPDCRELPEATNDIGELGVNDKGRRAYDPLCSKGPGIKEYHLTVYALSAEPDFGADKANRAKLLEVIKDSTLAEGTLDFKYERKR